MTTRRLPCTGVVLAGGGATRYGGEPKGLKRVGGERIIDRVARALRDAADDLLLVANDPDGARWLPGVRHTRDVREGEGSLGGIHTALARAGTAVLVVAWDMPFVPGALLAALRSRGEGASAALPESGSKRGVEPLCAYYDSSCLSSIERRLDAGDRRVVSFLADMPDVRHLSAREVAQFGDPELLFLNVNTPDDLGLAERHANATDGDRRRQEA